MARLEIDNIGVVLGGTEILKGVSLNVAEGECVALLGPSGCGKTTTLRAIAGFIVPDSGDIRFAGRSVRGLPPHKRNVGLVFQDYALFPHMTVAENVAYGLRMRRLGKAETVKRVADILDLVQLTGMEDRLQAQMSGGQRQRVALARALVIHPDVLLLDEPLGALDRKLRDQMQVEFKRIQREVGITTIFVTHDQEEALSLSDRVAVMFEGQIREIGLPAALYRRPESQDVMQFLGASNVISGTVREASDGTATVLCDGGLELRAVPGDGNPLPAVGQTVRVGCRPEHIAILPAAAPNQASNKDTNVISGIVEERVYKGPHAEIYVRAENGHLFAVHLSEGETAGGGGTGADRAAASSSEIGAEVRLEISPRNMLIFG